ncbi:MAG: hypothetical protein U0869_07785 [Chloroflexota bacterium]
MATVLIHQRDGWYVAGDWRPANEVILWGPFFSEEGAEAASQELYTLMSGALRRGLQGPLAHLTPAQIRDSLRPSTSEPSPSRHADPPPVPAPAAATPSPKSGTPRATQMPGQASPASGRAPSPFPPDWVVEVIIDTRLADVLAILVRRNRQLAIQEGEHGIAGDLARVAEALRAASTSDAPSTVLRLEPGLDVAMLGFMVRQYRERGALPPWSVESAERFARRCDAANDELALRVREAGGIPGVSGWSISTPFRPRGG